MNEDVLLLVEDNRYDEELTVKALKMQNLSCRVVVARDGVSALDYLLRQGKHAERPDSENVSLVLLDLNLPKLNGFEVLKKIRTTASTKLLPVVVLTSSNEKQDLLQSYNNGASSYIQKPVNFDHFMEVARHIGKYWLEINQAPPCPDA